MATVHAIERGAPFSLQEAQGGVPSPLFPGSGPVNGPTTHIPLQNPFRNIFICLRVWRPRPRAATGLAPGPTAGHDQAPGALPEPSTVYPRTISKLPASPSDCVTVNHFKDLAFPRGAGKCQAGVQSV